MPTSTSFGTAHRGRALSRGSASIHFIRRRRDAPSDPVPGKLGLPSGHGSGVGRASGQLPSPVPRTDNPLLGLP